MPEPHPYIINKNRIIVVKENGADYQLEIYRIHSLAEIEKAGGYRLDNWIHPEAANLPEKSRIAVVGDYLYLALGDWGIFDISDPDSINLICRNEIRGFATAIDAENKTVVVGNDNNSVFMYDITTKSSPSLIYAEYFGIMPPGKRAINNLRVIDEHVYFDHSQDSRMQVCHYEPGSHFILDRILSFSNYYITSEQVGGIWNQDRIIIYRNDITTEVTGKQPDVPESFQLYQNYPNPFNNLTQIEFDLAEDSQVEIVIYNINGQKVKVLYEGFKNAGAHRMTWNGRNDLNQQVSSGLYFYKIKIDKKSFTKKMIYIR